MKRFAAHIFAYRRRIAALLVIAVLCLFPVLSLADSTYLAIAGGSLNLRESGSLSAAVLGKYPTGTWVMFLEEGDTWDKVQVGSKTGYMMKSYLTAGSDAVVAVRYVSTGNGAGVNLRQSPSYSGMVITGVAEGTKVDVLVKGVDWYKVKVNDQTGYIASKYLSSSAGSASQYAVVFNAKNSQYLNLRETASLSANVLGRYKNYTPVSILQSGSTWCKVQVDGKTGYMMATYLKLTAAPFSATVKNSNGGSYVNLRSKGSVSASIIDTIAVGTSVTVLDKGTDWSIISADGVTGYVSTWFLVY